MGGRDEKEIGSGNFGCGGDMSGLFLLGVIGIWVAIVIFVVKWLARHFKPGVVRNIAVAITSAVMFVLPVADELISIPQFHRLCEEGTRLKFDPEKIRGRTIFLAENSQPDIRVGLLRGYYIPWHYLDATTKEVLITSSSYHVKGGILIRMLGISETNSPLTLRSYCSSSEKAWQKNLLDRYGLKYIERKDAK